MRLSLGVWLKGSTIYGGSVPPVPVLYATISPSNPVAGQLVTITFSAAPDTATVKLDGADLTVSGTGTTRTVTPATAGALTITATKDGYTSYSGGVTVLAEPVEDDFDLEYEPDGTLALVGVTEDGGILTITFTGSPDYSGTYTANVADYATGPVFLAPASISGNQTHGSVLTCKRGLPTYAGTVAGSGVAFQWLRDGVAITGETSSTYTINSATDAGTDLTCRVTATDANGSRSSTSNAITALGADDVPADTFTVATPTLLKDYIGESGIAWSTNSRFKAHPNGFVRSVYTGFQWRTGSDAPDQFAETLFLPSVDGVQTEGLAGAGPAVRITGDNAGYMADFGGNRRLYVSKRNGSTNTNLWFSPAGQSYPIINQYILRLEIRGFELTVLVNGVVVGTAIDPDSTYATGYVGLWGSPTTEQPALYAQGITSFHGGSL